MNTKQTIVLAGNPNCGKSTIFNALTKGKQHIGNYPGVTVEKKEGTFQVNDQEFQIIDLPGIYSLIPNSPEEIIARKVIMNTKPDLIVNIIDSSNLERNLYLTAQLMEMKIPFLLVFNMIDIAKQKGMKINLEQFSKLTGIPVLTAIGHKSIGLEDIKKSIVDFDYDNFSPKLRISKLGDHHFQEAFANINNLLEDCSFEKDDLPTSWYSIKYLEKDEMVIRKLENEIPDFSKIHDKATDIIQSLEKNEGDSSEIIIASHRYGYINSICRKTVHSTIETRNLITEKIDSVVTNKFLGIPIFLFMMFLVFKLTFVVGDPLMGWIESLFGFLSDSATNLWGENSESLLLSLIVDGVIGGVGGVLVFLPNILLLFFAIAILEGTGYMARAAFIMDRFMHKIGLHGKSFIPLLIGFGCTVPAIMATRTLESKRDRMTTMMVAPLMSCGARLPIYALIIPAFFPVKMHATMMWVIYLVGIVLAIVMAKLLRSTVFKGDAVPFIMELPPYHIPTARSLLIHMWDRAKVYLKKAGTIILSVSIVLWIISTFPQKKVFSVDYETKIESIQNSTISLEKQKSEIYQLENNRSAEELSYTIAGRIGHGLEPLLKPLGFDWKIGTALIGAFAAKEIFVSQLGIVYSIGEVDEESESLRSILRNTYSPLTGLCIILFCLISAPCVATIAVTKRESNSWKWALIQLGGLTLLAYIITLLVNQIGLLLGF